MEQFPSFFGEAEREVTDGDFAFEGQRFGRRRVGLCGSRFVQGRFAQDGDGVAVVADGGPARHDAAHGGHQPQGRHSEDAE